MSITLRNITVGDGIPKIAVPIISRTKAEIIADAAAVAASRSDIAEWRADYYEDLRDTAKTAQLSEEIRKILGDKLLLFTCRTAKEGGMAEIAEADYRELLLQTAAQGSADLIDAELKQSGSFLSELIETAHRQGMGVVVSYHNFAETPDEALLLGKYEQMRKSGADILKIAVMPKCEEDTDRMIAVSRKASRQSDKPIIAIGMGGLGRCTRIACEGIGSCLTFGIVGGESAPGQISADVLADMLERVHDNIGIFSSAADCASLNRAIGKYC